MSDRTIPPQPDKEGMRGRRSVSDIVYERAQKEASDKAIDNENRIANLEKRGPGHFHCKLYADPDHPMAIEVPEMAAVVSGDSQFHILVTDDLDGMEVVHVAASCATPGGAVVIQIRNGGPDGTGTVDILSTALQIDTGDNTSYTSAFPAVIDDTVSDVEVGDILWIDIDADGGVLGLNVIVRIG